MRYYIKLIILSTVFLLFTATGQIVLGKKTSDSCVLGDAQLPQTELRRLSDVIAAVKKYYYKSITDKSIFDKAISGMISNLDPHSTYLGPDELKELNMQTLGKFSGIGVEVFPDRGAIMVINPIDDTPAYRAGIKPGDYIIQINNKIVRDMKLHDAVNMMRGPAGSKVNLKIVRKNASKPLTFNLRREVIKIKKVKERLLEPGYGYIRLALFQEPTEKDMVRALQHLQKISKVKLKGLVLDLRNNSGGLFDAAVKVADKFLDEDRLGKNNVIVYTKGKNDEVQVVAHATPGEVLVNIPIVVLINEGSASAAEIVAGALQDHKRAIIAGTRSFGKGSVQILLPIDKNSAIKLTTALYYTPLGRLIQAKGIEPDINIDEIQISREQKHRDFPRVYESTLADHIQNGDENNKTVNDSLEGLNDSEVEISQQQKQLVYDDYQLYEALQILKSKATEIRI